LKYLTQKTKNQGNYGFSRKFGRYSFADKKNPAKWAGGGVSKIENV
jgi:hypothetical protein